MESGENKITETGDEQDYETVDKTDDEQDGQSDEETKENAGANIASTRNQDNVLNTEAFNDTQFKLIHVFQVETEDREPWIRHIEILSDGNILLGDRYNKQLLLYDCNGIRLKQVKMTSGPWSMAITNNNLVAITLPDDKTVAFVFTETLRGSHKFLVRDDCRGIACIGNKLFVNCVTNGLKLLTMKGRTLKVFPQYVGYMSLAKGPNERLLATLFAEDRIICLDLKGKLRYEFIDKSLSGPSGFATDLVNEYLYIVGHNGNNIHMIGDKGEKSKILLSKKDGIDRPWAVSYDSCVKKLFISTFGGKNIMVLQRVEAKPDFEFKSLSQKKEEK
ncbi:unnamed protein product [Mytilus coruscus]|uniref:Uncharacterized protein n=1 Tax=Mytilus coruscus TaxID=42192 RepID=A0A6J8DEE1_MYTCO|nr:unnamed protein product [Mytilus coruscus]